VAYFTDYYTSYFDIETGVEPAVERPRQHGSLAPSMEEWQEYLRRWHELRRQEAAEFAARKGVRALIREQMWPAPKTVAEIVTQAVTKAEMVERTETRIHLKQFDASDIRAEMARLLLDIRKRAKVIKRQRLLTIKRKKEEEALLMLWDG
jgi:hypothetical protein